MAFRVRKLAKLGFLTIAVACLATGDALVRQWGLVALAVLAWITGVLAAGWFTAVFIAIVSLAATGVWAGAWPPLMILGATLALASWDLANWEDFMANGLPVETVPRIERGHYASLALALGGGMVIVMIGRLVSFHFPFGFLAIVATLAMVGVDQLWRLFKG